LIKESHGWHYDQQSDKGTSGERNRILSCNDSLPESSKDPAQECGAISIDTVDVNAASIGSTGLGQAIIEEIYY